MMRRAGRMVLIVSVVLANSALAELETLPIPDKTVVLTFDDGNKSDVAFVAPLLKKHGFGATFYVTSAWLNQAGRLTWADLNDLTQMGFEIGNHSVSHPNFLNLSKAEIRSQLAGFDRECVEHGLEKTTTFAYPGGHHDHRTITLLAQHGYASARRGNDPEFPLLDEGGPGVVFSPTEDDPFLVPSTFLQGPIHTTLDSLKMAVAKAHDGKIAVLTFHGVPDVHPHCSTPPELFAKYVEYLNSQRCNVIAMRDLQRYVDLSRRFPDPYASIKSRLAAMPTELRVETLASSGPHPVFRWRFASSARAQSQTGYRVLVASSAEKIRRGVGDLWDSGKVSADQNYDIVYQGAMLRPGTTYWWSVKTWGRTADHYLEQIGPFNAPVMIEYMRNSMQSEFSQPKSFIHGELSEYVTTGLLADGISVTWDGAKSVNVDLQTGQQSGHSEGNLVTKRGVVRYRCDYEELRMQCEVTVPVNMTATVKLPKRGRNALTITSGSMVVWSNGALVDRINGIHNGRDLRDSVACDVGPGTYRFHVTAEE